MTHLHNIFEDLVSFLNYGNVFISRKIMELEEELKVVGNSLKSLEVSEEKVRMVFKYFIRLPNIMSLAGDTFLSMIDYKAILYLVVPLG